MKRSLVAVLLVVVFAGWIGTLISRDPGYVLISYDGSSLQTSLWVAFGLLAAVVMLLYYGLRFTKLIAASETYWRNWRVDRKKSQSFDLTAKGMKFFNEGEFERAEKFLIGGAVNNSLPAVNYIAAARAADKQNKLDQREQYLRSAEEADSSASQAVAIASAEMRASRSEWQRCLEILAPLKSSNVVDPIRQQAYLELKDWKSLLQLLPSLKKRSANEAFLALEKKVVLGRFNEGGLTDDSLKIIYKKLSVATKNDTDVVLAYCEAGSSDQESESVLRHAIKENWQGELVLQYGDLGSETLQKRSKQVQAWLKNHQDDAALQLCVGKIYQAQGDRAKAREAFEKSLTLENSSQANELLAGLLAFDGDYSKSHEHLKTALHLIHTCS
jgi:HemY protein